MSSQVTFTEVTALTSVLGRSDREALFMEFSIVRIEDLPGDQYGRYRMACYNAIRRAQQLTRERVIQACDPLAMEVLAARLEVAQDPVLRNYASTLKSKAVMERQLIGEVSR